MSFYKRWLNLFAIAFIVLAAFGGRQPAALAAGTFFVTTTKDLNTAPPACDGIQPAPYDIGTPCSLRQALQKANATASAANPVSIKFNIKPGNAIDQPGYDDSDNTAITWTITPTLALPAIQASDITIDGNSQAKFIGGQPNQSGPEIIIDGSKIGTVAGGLTIFKQASNCVINGLGIIKFGGGIAGIQIDGSNNSVLGNYIGIDKYGKNPAPNSGPGVWITTSGEGNTIGGNSSSADEFNTISGNNSDGVFIQGSNNSVLGNLIGTDRFGSVAVPNQRNGIYVFSNANGNTIGTDATATDAKFRNLISGNSRYGIYIDSASDNNVYGNYVGIDSSTLKRIPNGTAITAPVGTYGGIQIGASIAAATNNTIGGAGIAARNVIAGNVGPGINIFGAEASGNTIVNNYVGISFNGAVPSGGTTSHTVGILLNQGANGNTIGGGTGARNVISGNGGDGIEVLGDIDPTVNANTDNNAILGNYIGTNVIGTAAISNTGSGIVVGTFADFTAIGGTTEPERNLIAYNGVNGITVRPNTPGDPAILTTTLNLNTVKFNTGVGVLFDTADYNAINGTDVMTNTGIGLSLTGTNHSTMHNGVVWGNGANGIQIKSAQDSSMQPHDVRNNVVGVSVADSFVTTIEGAGANARASITSNASHGIQVSNSISTTIQYVDTTPVHEGDPGNGGDGVNAVNALMNIKPDRQAARLQADCLGSEPICELYISNSKIDRNGGVGVNVSDAEFVHIEGTAAQRTTVSNNTLEGVLFNNVISGTVQYQDLWNNQNDGLRVQGDSEDVSVYRNILRFNGPQNANGATFETSCSLDPAVQRTSEGQGISIRDAAKHVRIIRSLFGQNCGLGILRDPNGPDPSTPNEGIQPPIITTLNQTGELRGKLQGDCSKDKCVGWIVELFNSNLVSEANPAGVPDGEGNIKVNLPEDQIKTFDAQGNFSFALNPSRIGGLPQQLLGTATDKNGNTSEFGIFNITRGVVIEPPRITLNAYPTQVITYYHTVTNTGSLDDSFRLSYRSEQGLGSDNVKLQPSGNFGVPAGKSVPVTVTLILPGGSDPRVRAGLTEHTYITVTSVTGPRPGTDEVISDVVTDTTTFTRSGVITVTPLTAVGQTKVGKSFAYPHQITNNGNITATVVLSFDPDPTKRPLWPTTVSVAGTPSVAPITSVTGGTITISLAPGQSRTMTVSVAPPTGASAGAKDTAIIYVNVPEYPTQSKVVSDTTTVLVDTKASIIPDREGNGAAGRISIYQHIVQNISNGSVRLKLVADPSNLGATVTFESTTPGVALDAQNTFTLGTSSGTNLLNFNAKVAIPATAPLGSVDIITIKLVDAVTGEVLGTVQDRTIITEGITAGVGKRIVLPIIIK